jgi:hypothetical protein
MRPTADRRRRRSADQERGAVLVLFAFLLVALTAISAVVVDLGVMRVMRRSNQNLADFAALAAGEAMSADPGPRTRDACRDAVDYLRLNADGLVSLSLACNSLPEPCTAATSPVTIQNTAGAYSVRVTHPVRDSSIADLRVAGGLRVDDGEPCERLAVQVERVEASLFSRILGRTELTASATSVIRQISAQNRRVPSLWLLDPVGCNVLTVQGGANVTVGTPTMAGLVSLDSDGSVCSGNSYTVDVGGSGSRLHAIPSNTDPPGMISLFAMAPGQTTCGTGNLRACDISDINNGTLSPQPVRRPSRATRAPVDHAYNCRSTYPDYHGFPVAPCEDATASSGYIHQLRTAVGATGVPAGFTRWGAPTHSCTPSGTFVLTGNWVVDCSDFRVGNGADVTFNGNVIFNGDVRMSGSGRLTVNASNPSANLPSGCVNVVTGCLANSSSEAAWAYMRNGDLRLNGGFLTLRRTMLYQHDGNFTINGSAPPVWTAPSQGPFAGLAVWSEKPSTYSINGGASMELEGVFFTPFADPFALSGGAPFIPQRAQFISYRAKIDGGAVLTLSPNSMHAITIPAPPVSLIR